LYRYSTVDSAAAGVAVQALPVLARLLAIPRTTAQHEAALGFYWVGRLRSQEGRWRANYSSSAGHDTLEASISAAERDSVASLLDIISKAEEGEPEATGTTTNSEKSLVAVDGNQFTGEGEDETVTSITKSDKDVAKSVAEAAASALCTMARVPTLAAAILDASPASSALRSGLECRATRCAVLSLLLTCAKHDECKARIVTADLVDALLSIASEPGTEDRPSFLTRLGGGSKTNNIKWWINPHNPEQGGDEDVPAAATAAQIVMSLFAWGGNGNDGDSASTSSAWLTDAPNKGRLREPAMDVIKRARAAATSCLALAANHATTEDWREGWCHAVHSAAVSSLAATVCTVVGLNTLNPSC
jgi:hypothetical protein